MKKIIKFIKENPIEFVMSIILLYVVIQAIILGEGIYQLQQKINH